MYSSYTAASFARKHDLADRHGVNLEGALTWAFEFEDQPLLRRLPLAGDQRHRPAGAQRVPHVQPDGRRALAATATAPCRLDAMLKAGVREKPDVAALASLDAKPRASSPGTTTTTTCRAPRGESPCRSKGSAMKQGKAKLQHFRIDETHSNAYTAWQRLGSPACADRRAVQAARGSERAGAARRRAGNAWTSSMAGPRSRSRCRGRRCRCS